MASRTQYGSARPCPLWRADRRSREGMALVLVLWIMVILGAVALGARFSSHLRVQVTANLGASAKAHYLARAGIERAMADLAAGRNEVQAERDLSEDADSVYHSVELGEGTYTLFVGFDADGDPVYGIGDESAKLNLNTSEEAVLAKVPNMDADLAAAVVEQRKVAEFHDVGDLLLVEMIDKSRLYGEDQNRNGLLDPNEDDGDASWPPDNGDGHLDAGLAQYLTTWSAARDVAADGTERVNLGTASAQEIRTASSEISEQQAEAIVAYCSGKTLASVAELLDVELVEKSGGEQSGKPKPENGESPERPQRTPPGRPGNGPRPNGSNGGDSGKQNANQAGAEDERDKRPKEGAAGPEAQDSKKPGGKKPEAKPKTTGKKAFTLDQFRKIADLVSVADDDVLAGKVNLNTAPAEVLACLPGLDDALARGIAHARQGRADGFTTVTDILDVDGIGVDIFKQVCPHVSTRSDVFGVRSFGVIRDGEVVRYASAIVDRTEDELRIRYWREEE